MLDWFAGESTVSYGKESIPAFDYIKTQVSKELDKVVNYYRTNPTFVKNEHLLVQILLNVTVSMDREDEEYLYRTAMLTNRLGNQFSLTSATAYGRVRSPGLFYGSKCDEIILVHETPFDLEDAINNWEDLQPVTVLRHPFTDMSFQRGRGSYITKEQGGISVVAINIPMLCIQYREWVKSNTADGGLTKPLTQFVSMYPITNMLYTHTDISMFNRLSNIYQRESSASFIRAHSLYINDFTVPLDAALKMLVRVLGRKVLLWEAMVENIECIHSTSLREAMSLPDVVPTRQVKWALIVARLPLIHFLVMVNPKSNATKNALLVRRLKSTLRAIRVDRILDGALPRRILMDIDSAIINDIDPLI